MELALTARPIEASESAAIGLVNQVVPVGQALATALSMAAQIAANEAAAVSATKQLLRLSLSGDLASARQRESAANAAYLGSTEHRRVFADFVRTTLDRPNS
jgi:enoyl-CoA hydratase/carnithine racemase